MHDYLSSWGDKKTWNKITARAWSDPTFKKKLLENPVDILTGEGLSIPKGYKVQIHEQKNKVIHLNLPEKPEGELSEDQLLKIAAGVGPCGMCY